MHITVKQGIDNCYLAHQYEHPGYEEVCRRFLADQKDFSEENLAAAGITRRYQNDDKVRCKEEIVEVIRDGKL